MKTRDDVDPQQKSLGTLRKGNKKLRPQLGHRRAGGRKEVAVRRQMGLEKPPWPNVQGIAGEESAVAL